ncbi:MAG: phosphatase PAP2 family protein [Rickettsiales bacterium]|nr:phosphatase PAP2 family protein [Rickettsiales bacterium]
MLLEENEAETAHAISKFLLDVFYHWFGLNESLFLSIYRIQGESYSLWMKAVTQLGNYHNFPYYLGAVIAFIALSVAIKTIRGEPIQKRHMALWVSVLAILVAGHIINGVTIIVIKNYSEFPRPYVELSSEQVEGLDRRDEPDEQFRSFPSGHAAFITMILMSLWPVLSSGIRLFALCLALTIYWSRMALGMHFPADIVGGILITVLVMRLVKSVVFSIVQKIFKVQLK